MGNTVPLISTSVAGPLGVIQLPRLWSKLLLAAKGKLADGYKSCGGGFDLMVIDGLGLDRDATVAFVTEKLPTYPEFEAWVLKSAGGSISPQAIEAINSGISAYEHRDEVRESVLSAAGMADRTDIRDAVTLNNLDDWTEFHRQLVNE